MIEIGASSELGAAVRRARAALSAGEAERAAEAYAAALSSVEDGAETRRALWVEHVGGLLRQERPGAAERTARAYLDEARRRVDGRGVVELLVLLGEAQAARGHWSGCRESLASLDRLLSAEPHLDPGDPALTRLRGLVALEDGRARRAVELLRTARDAFARPGDNRGVRVVENDLRRLRILAGDPAVVEEVLAGERPESVPERLLYARALRRDARFEAAARVLEEVLVEEMEPALRFPALHELVLLRQLLADRDAVERLLPLLREAAPLASEPEEARASLELLEKWQEGGFTETAGSGFEARLHGARSLVQQGRLDEAERRLLRLRGDADTPRFAAYWSLAAGELELSLGERESGARAREHGREALAQLAEAADLAWATSLSELFAEALRLGGRAQAQLLDDIEAASEQWARAARADDLIAHRQESDAARVRYLEVRPTELDELVEAAAARVTEDSLGSVAGVLAAIEGARGGAILSLVLPAAAPRLREVPLPNDAPACWSWYKDLALKLPRDLAVWCLHATADRLHHVLAGRGILHWAAFPVDRSRLTEAIDRSLAPFAAPELLEALVQERPEEARDPLAALAELLRTGEVLDRLPDRIGRLAVVAGGALSEIPFAGLPYAAGSEPLRPLIERFALSDLPCLSAYLPLRERAAGSRDETGLVVRPPAADLAPGDKPAGFGVLEGARATVAGLERQLDRGRPAIVQLDCHGAYADDRGLESWLQLAPGDGDDGRLTARRMQSLGLDRCGTLVLGACEAGMAQRIGRDERVGFVRAGVAAGGSAVLAARWVAADLAAAHILSRFHRYLGWLPRDRALQRAQLDLVDAGRAGRFAGRLPRPDHPARWACWTLYGDAGLQTRAGWLRRGVRRLVARWRRRSSGEGAGAG